MSLRMVVAAASLLAAAAGGARAASYNISFDGYCDEMRFTVTDSLVVGVSYAFNEAEDETCDDANVVGTVVQLPKTIAPGGTVAVLASDFGRQIYGQYIMYVNLRDRTWTEYFSEYGTTAQFALAGTWSPIVAGTQAKTAARPSLLSAFWQKAKPVPAHGGGAKE